MALHTDRLTLRQWCDDDREPWAAMNADPKVMAHFPAPLTRNQADTFVAWASDQIDRLGWGLWAIEEVSSGAFAGMTGLLEVTFDAPFAPAVEIGWRLPRWAWGRGYATEAARAALDHAFGPLGLEEVLAFTATTNAASIRVMERLAMEHDIDGDFDHPRVPESSALRHHVLYRMTASRWRDLTPGRRIAR